MSYIVDNQTGYEDAKKEILQLTSQPGAFAFMTERQGILNIVLDITLKIYNDREAKRLKKESIGYDEAYLFNERNYDIIGFQHAARQIFKETKSRHLLGVFTYYPKKLIEEHFSEDFYSFVDNPKKLSERRNSLIKRLASNQNHEIVVLKNRISELVSELHNERQNFLKLSRKFEQQAEENRKELEAKKIKVENDEKEQAEKRLKELELAIEKTKAKEIIDEENYKKGEYELDFLEIRRKTRQDVLLDCMEEGRKRILSNKRSSPKWKLDSIEDEFSQLFLSKVQKELASAEKRYEDLKRQRIIEKRNKHEKRFAKKELTALAKQHRSALKRKYDLSFDEYGTPIPYRSSARKARLDGVDTQWDYEVYKFAESMGRKVGHSFRYKVRLGMKICSEIVTEIVTKAPYEESPFEDLSSGADYENYCAEKLELLGWKVKHTPASGDQGADLIAEKMNYKVVIQCKFHKSTVGNKAVQEVLSAMQFYDCKVGAVVASSSFTKSARALASSGSIQLLHHDNLSSLAEA